MIAVDISTLMIRWSTERWKDLWILWYDIIYGAYWYALKILTPYLEASTSSKCADLCQESVPTTMTRIRVEKVEKCEWNFWQQNWQTHAVMMIKVVFEHVLNWVTVGNYLNQFSSGTRCKIPGSFRVDTVARWMQWMEEIYSTFLPHLIQCYNSPPCHFWTQQATYKIFQL